MIYLSKLWIRRRSSTFSQRSRHPIPYSKHPRNRGFCYNWGMRLRIEVGQCKECLQEFPREKFKINKHGYLADRRCGSCRIKIMNQKLGYDVDYRELKGDTCEVCGFKGHYSQLDVDYKDGNHKNHNPSNLQTLCANCHRLKSFMNKDNRRTLIKQSKLL